LCLATGSSRQGGSARKSAYQLLSFMHGGCIDSNDESLEWAVGFLFGKAELSLELWEFVSVVARRDG
jgi:hypothetical protein